LQFVRSEGEYLGLPTIGDTQAGHARTLDAMLRSASDLTAGRACPREAAALGMPWLMPLACRALNVDKC